MRTEHRAYFQRYDGRTRAVSRLTRLLLATLVRNPSPQEKLIAERAALKAVRCALLEAAILRGNHTPQVDQDYLRFARELREDLKTLGITPPDSPDKTLQQYLEESYA